MTITQGLLLTLCIMVVLFIMSVIITLILTNFDIIEIKFRSMLKRTLKVKEE